MKPFCVTGIDPGLLSSGVADFFGREDDEKSVNGVGILDNKRLESEMRVLGPDIAIELIGHYGTGMPAGRDVFDTCIWIGRFIGAIKANGHTVKLLGRPTIKAHLCGSAKAKDANVRQALLDRLGPQGTKKNPGPTYGIKSHMWSALAVAVTAYDLWDQLEEVE